MSLRLRVGSVSVSSRGRIGAGVGPLSGSIGPRRRRANTNPLGCLVFVVVFAVIMVAGALHHHRGHGSLARAERAHAITRGQYDAVRYRQRRADVTRRLGSPEPAARIATVQGMRSKVHPHCIFYNMDDGSLGDAYRLCFDHHGHVKSRDAYYLGN